MDDEKIKKLKQILRRSEGGNPQDVRKEAREFLKGIDANELIMAEQEIIKEGIDPKSLSHLCSAHLEMMSGELQALKDKIPEDHPIAVMISEHDEILKFLNQLEEVGSEIQAASKFEELPIGLFDLIKHLTGHLLAAEKHHRREEEVLFPELRKFGVFGPPEIMVDEHKYVRELEDGLSKLLEKQDKQSYAEFKKKFAQVNDILIQSLRDHIFKENNILYPAALQIVPAEDWKRIGEAADAIGYCCFTPKHLAKAK